MENDDYVWAFFHPTNKHDPHAIRIDSKSVYAEQTESSALGWVAKHQTRAVRKFIENCPEYNEATKQAYFKGAIGIPMRVRRIKPGFSAGCVELYSNYTLLLKRIVTQI